MSANSNSNANNVQNARNVNTDGNLNNNNGENSNGVRALVFPQNCNFYLKGYKPKLRNKYIPIHLTVNENRCGSKYDIIFVFCICLRPHHFF